MREWLESLDPSTRQGLLVAGVFVLAFGTVLSSILLGYVVSYAQEKPAFSRVATVLLVGVVTAAVTVGGIVNWWYMHVRYGWFPGGWGWFWSIAWFCVTVTSFQTANTRRILKAKKGAKQSYGDRTATEV